MRQHDPFGRLYPCASHPEERSRSRDRRRKLRGKSAYGNLERLGRMYEAVELLQSGGNDDKIQVAILNKGGRHENIHKRRH